MIGNDEKFPAINGYYDSENISKFSQMCNQRREAEVAAGARKPSEVKDGLYSDSVFGTKPFE